MLACIQYHLMDQAYNGPACWRNLLLEKPPNWDQTRWTFFHQQQDFTLQHALFTRHRWNIFDPVWFFRTNIHELCFPQISIQQILRVQKPHHHHNMLKWKPPKIMWPCTNTMKLKLATIFWGRGRRVIERILILLLGTPSEKNYGIIWEFFPYRGGGSSQFPKLL